MNDVGATGESSNVDPGRGEPVQSTPPNQKSEEETKPILPEATKGRVRSEKQKEATRALTEKRLKLQEERRQQLTKEDEEFFAWQEENRQKKQAQKLSKYDELLDKRFKTYEKQLADYMNAPLHNLITNLIDQEYTDSEDTQLEPPKKKKKRTRVVEVSDSEEDELPRKKAVRKDDAPKEQPKEPPKPKEPVQPPPQPTKPTNKWSKFFSWRGGEVFTKSGKS